MTGIYRRVSEKGESRNKRVCCSLSGPVLSVQRKKATRMKEERKREREREREREKEEQGRKRLPLNFHDRLHGR